MNWHLLWSREVPALSPAHTASALGSDFVLESGNTNNQLSLSQWRFVRINAQKVVNLTRKAMNGHHKDASDRALLCRSFSVVWRNIAVWPHLSLLWSSESWGCNKKGSVTWILNLCGSSAFPVKVNWGKRDKRHWLNSVAESVFFFLD